MGARARASVLGLERGNEERELLAAVAGSGDRAAFNTLCRRFAPRLQAFLQSRTGHDAQELVQETLLTVWRKAALYDPRKAAPSTWIFTIARNKAIDASRRHRPAPNPADPHWVERAGPSARPAPDVHAEALQTQARLREALQSLPHDQAEVLRHVYLQGLTLREAAEGLNVPLGTAKSRVRLALASLRKHFANEEANDGE